MDLEIFRHTQRKVTSLCAKEKSTFLYNKIEENSTNQKSLFRIANDLLLKKKTTTPSYSH